MLLLWLLIILNTFVTILVFGDNENLDSMKKEYTSLPVVTVDVKHQYENEINTYTLNIYEDEDTIYQVRRFCNKYNFINIQHCRKLEQTTINLMFQYLATLEKNREIMMQNSTHFEMFGAKNFPETKQDCDKRTRSCRFKNLYFDATDGNYFLNNCDMRNIIRASERQFSLLGRGDMSMETYYGSGDKEYRNLYNFSTRCIDGYFSDREYEERRTLIEPMIEHFVNKTVLLAKRFDPLNAGHLMLETAIPLEKLANWYGVGDIKSRVLLFDDDCNSKRCASFTNRFLSPLTRSTIMTSKRIMLNDGEVSNGAQFIVIPDVIVGIGEFSPYTINEECGMACCSCGACKWNNMSDARVSYVKKVYQHADIDAPVSKFRPDANVIGEVIVTFLYKIGRSGILNYVSVISFLDGWCKNRGCLLEFMNLATSTFEYQLETLARTDILLSAAGSTAMSSFFLPPESSMIIFPLIRVTSEEPVMVWETTNELLAVFDSSFRNSCKLYKYTDWDTTLLSRMEDFLLTGHKMGSFNVSIAVLEEMLLEAYYG